MKQNSIRLNWMLSLGVLLPFACNAWCSQPSASFINVPTMIDQVDVAPFRLATDQWQTRQLNIGKSPLGRSTNLSISSQHLDDPLADLRLKIADSNPARRISSQGAASIARAVSNVKKNRSPKIGPFDDSAKKYRQLFPSRLSASGWLDEYEKRFASHRLWLTRVAETFNTKLQTESKNDYCYNHCVSCLSEDSQEPTSHRHGIGDLTKNRYRPSLASAPVTTSLTRRHFDSSVSRPCQRIARQFRRWTSEQLLDRLALHSLPLETWQVHLRCGLSGAPIRN